VRGFIFPPATGKREATALAEHAPAPATMWRKGTLGYFGPLASQRSLEWPLHGIISHLLILDNIDILKTAPDCKDYIIKKIRDKKPNFF